MDRGSSLDRANGRVVEWGDTRKASNVAPLVLLAPAFLPITVSGVGGREENFKGAIPRILPPPRRCQIRLLGGAGMMGWAIVIPAVIELAAVDGAAALSMASVRPSVLRRRQCVNSLVRK